MLMKKFLKWIAYTVAGALVLVVLLAGGLFAFLETDRGRDWALALLLDTIEQDAGLTIAVGATEGRLLDRVVLRDLSVSAEGERIASAASLEIDWRPRRLLGWTLAVDHLILREPVLHKAPPAGETPAGEPFLALPSLRLPVGLAVRDIRIEGLDLRPAVAGVPARFELEGHAIASAALDQLDLAVDLRRTDRAGDRARFTLRADPGTGALNMDAALTEAPGGMIGRLLEAGENGLTLRLSGQGDLTAWQGRLVGEVGDQPVVQADLGLRGGPALGVSLSGRARPRLLSPALAPLGDWWQVELEGAIDRSDVTVESLTLRTRPGSLRADGRFDRSGETVDARVEADIADLAPIGQLAGTPLAGRGNLRLAIAGAAAAPVMRIDADLGDIQLDDIRAEHLMLSADAEPLGDGAQDDSWSVSGEVRVRRLQPPGRSGVVETVEEFAATMRVELAPARQTVGFQDIAIRADFLQIAGNLDYDYGDTPRLAGRLSLAGTPPRALTGGVTIGASELDVDFDADPERWRGRISATGRIDAVQTGEASLDRLLEGGVDIGIDGEFSETRVAVDRLQLTGTGFLLTGDGALLPDEDSEISLSLDLPRLEVLSAALGETASGSATADIRLTGTPSRIAAGLTVNGRMVRIADVEFGALRIDADIDDLLADSFAARLRAEAEGPVTPLRVSTRLEQLGDERLRFADIQAAAAGANASGEITVNLSSGLLDGPFELRADDLRTVGRLVDEDLRGRLRARGRLVARDGRQALNLTASVEAPALGGDEDGLSAERLELDGSVGDLASLSGLEGEASLFDARIGDFQFDAVTATARRQGELTAFTVSARAQERVLPLLLDAEGTLEMAAEETRIGVTRLALTHGQAEARLQEATRITLAPGRVALARTVLTVRGGRLTLEGAIADGRIEAELTAAGLPADLLERMDFGPPVTGALSGEVRAAGSLDSPQLDFRLAAENLAPLQQSGEADTISISAEGSARDGRLRADGEARGLGARPLSVSADLPFRWGRPIADGAAVAGSARGDIDLARLAALGLLRGHRAAGELNVDFTLGGSYGSPVLDGQASLADGVFENTQTGTLLREIALRLGAERNRLDVRGTATDGGNGRVSLDGRLNLSTSQAFPFEATIGTERATLLRRDEIEATLTSDLDATGNFVEGVAITGTMTVNQAEIRIPDRLPVEVVFLDVEERNTPPHLVRPARVELERAPPLPVTVDITVDVPRRTFLRGRGIETEWQGRLQVTGALPDPRVTGTLSTVRGSVDVLGKRFEVEEGQVRFDRDDFADPSLSIRATGKRDELTAIILIDGSAQDPRLTLSAEPERPPEEVLSHVLFGKDVSELSAIEAAQLAAAVAQLLGPGGGTDIVARIRQTLGLDVLEFTEGEQTPGVRAGRYIGDRTLLTVEQGAATESSRVGVEVEVLDNLVIESNVGAQGDTRVGVQYRLDY